MSKVPSLRIRRLAALHYYVQDLERSRRFYTEMMDFQEIGCSDPDLEKRGRQKSVVFEAGECRIVVSQPMGDGGRASRYLRKHPDGIGTLIFEVEDAAHAFKLLDSRGGTPIDDIQTFRDEGGTLSFFSITTPFGDTTFRFLERSGYRGLAPGFIQYDTPRGGRNAFGIVGIDHITSNFQTMKPTLLWLEHVLGFEQFWNIEFHTRDVAEMPNEGSGLRSTVMWDPVSQTKFANNEPLRPFFKQSQINIFGEEQRGDGVQHAALSVRDLVSAVRGLRDRGVQFMETPKKYYELLPERLVQSGIQKIDEEISTLQDLQILVDGAKPHSYLLQIFLKESAGLYGDPSAGPFFFELIQRKGDEGFGGGNFRALFESIERDQRGR